MERVAREKKERERVEQPAKFHQEEALKIRQQIKLKEEEIRIQQEALRVLNVKLAEEESTIIGLGATPLQLKEPATKKKRKSNEMS